ncbi:MAG: hypothetical protein M1822_007494 [Bathelium mastoideum]|nr:MAG: hypothetical protein M1822_007494 [Bathelium mastoideum]
MSEATSSSRPASEHVREAGRHDGDAPCFPPAQRSRIDDANTAAASNNRDAFAQNAAVSIDTGASLVERLLQSPTERTLHVQSGSNSPSVDALKSNSDPASLPTSPSRSVAMLESATVPATYVQRQPLRSTLSVASMASSLSPRSAISSPQLAALGDITPLPSPLIGGDSPALWGRARAGSGARPISQGSLEVRMGTSAVWKEGAREQAEPAGSKSPPASRSPPRSKKSYGLSSPAGELQGAQEQAVRHENIKSHGRNRSISEFVPEALHNVRLRNVTVSSAHPPVLPDTLSSSDTQLHREKYLAERRGLHASSAPDATSTLPSPPPSNKSVTEGEDEDERDRSCTNDSVEYMTIRCGKDHVKKFFRPMRVLGQGTFSKVILATNQKLSARLPLEESKLDPRKLVAVKVIEHGPAGGADEERIETGLKREIEIMKAILHPSLVHLKAFDQDEHRALLVLTYCPGCDLFDLASEHRSLLSPSLIQRMFAELVSAICYLHENYIVHRDIKLENVLVNIPQPTLPNLGSYQTFSHPLITLTDLGLSRRIPRPPASPLLTTRCGSEDYAAPEILLGQPYDGRATDAWALGVLLYALMEGRLPFDPVPGARGPSRASHRIARADWMWCAFGNEDGEWDGTRPGAAELAGAHEVVEGLLRKVRMGRKSVGEVAEMEWVKGGIQVEGGLKIGDEHDDSDILRPDPL